MKVLCHGCESICPSAIPEVLQIESIRQDSILFDHLFITHFFCIAYSSLSKSTLQLYTVLKNQQVDVIYNTHEDIEVHGHAFGQTFYCFYLAHH